MIFELFYSLLLVTLFTTQYFINKKRGAVDAKPKESMLAAAALALLPVVMVVLVLTKTEVNWPYLSFALRCVVLALVAVWLVQNLSQIKSLLQKQE